MFSQLCNEQACSGWHYQVISENWMHIDLGEYATYSIQVTGDGSTEKLHDVSVSKETVDWMVELFNKYQLSPIHLQNAVEDLLP